MAHLTSQEKIDKYLADYEERRKNGGADKASADKGKSQYQASQDKISGYMKEHEEVLRNSPSRQQMIALERKVTEEAARKKAQLQANVQQALRDQAIDSVESQALAAIKQRLNQGLGEFRQTDLQQGPFSGYQDPVELALQAQDLKGVGPQKTWRAEALKLGQQAVEKKRQEYAQQGSVKDYAERFKQKQTVVPDEKERTENVYKYAQEVPYMADFEEISSKEGANTKRKRTEEEAKKYEEEIFWAEVNGSSMPLAMRNQEQDLIDKYVSDQQLKVYNYLVNSGQQEYADEYWRGVKAHAQTLRNADDIKSKRDALAKLPEGFARDTVSSAVSVALNMVNAVTSTYYIAEQEIREALTGERQELDPQDMAFQAGRARDALRQDVSEKLPGWGKFLYDTGISMADTVAMGALLGPTGGALLMGSGAAVDTVRDVKERGGSDQQALTMGLIAGGAELLTEKLGFKRLEKMIGGSRGNVFREILGAMASEAGEEGVTEIANILTDVLVMGDKSEYDALVRQYVLQGLTEKEAHIRAVKDMAGQVVLSALGGGLMGGVMGGGAAVVGTVARAAEQTAQRNAWREAVDYDAATNIFTEGVRGGSTYENMRRLAEQAYDRQQETATQSSAALASLGKGEADASPASRTVSPTIERMAQEYGEDASVFISNYNGSDPAQYKRGFDAMFNAGKSGLSLEMLGGVSDQLTAGMDEATKQSIYTAGRNRAANTITPGVQRLTTKKLGNNQKTQLMILDAIGKEYGLEIDVVDSIKDSNAVYRKGGRRIVVGLDAAEGAYVQAAAHEAVHYIRSMSPDGYDVLKNVVLEHLTGEDAMFDLETAISERMKQYEKANRQLSREDAIEEIVAEAVPTFFGDKEAVRAFVSENRTLAEKIRDFFVEFAKKVREIAERYMVSQDRAEIAELLGNTEALKEIAQTFDLALREAQEKPGGKADGEVVTSRNESERNRSIPEGSMKNKFYGALTRQEWAGYFETLKRPEYDADLYDDGQRAYMVRGGKLVLMEMQDTGEFSVVDVYSGVTEWYNDDIRNILGEWEEGRYDERDIRAWFETIAVNAGSKVLQAYDRHSGRFVPVVGKQNGAGRGAAGVSGGRDAHGAGVREDAVGQDQGEQTKFSLKKPVEETKTLIAVHNLTEAKLKKAMELGGLPMPSIAVAKAELGHQTFGNISLVFGRETIDPKANKKNKVYSADAWTPTFPRIEYEADERQSRKVYSEMNELARKVPEYYRDDIKRVINDIDYQLNQYEGENGLIENLMDNYGFKAAYLASQGEPVVMAKTTKTEGGVSGPQAERYEKILAIFDGNAHVMLNTPLRQLVEQHRSELEKVLPDRILNDSTILARIISGAAEYSTGSMQPKQVEVSDVAATNRQIDERIDADAYRQWATDLFSGIEGQKGVANGKHPYTPSGSSRSFAQTHYPVSVENIAKAMMDSAGGNVKNISGFHGVKSLRASTAEEFSSVAAMHKREGRIQARTQEEVGALTSKLDKQLDELIWRILETKSASRDRNEFIAFDTVGTIIMEDIADGKYTEDSIRKVLTGYGYQVDDAIVKDLKGLLDEVANMPVNIFEAKPERAVYFDEVKAAIVPDNMNIGIRGQLESVVENVIEYPAGDETARLEALNGLDEYAFSLKSTAYPTGEEAREAAEANRAQTQTEEFKAWFDGSVVVNEDGTPKIMYHGTSKSGFNWFRTQEGRYGLMGMGAYFTENPEVAQGYTRKGRGTTPGVYPVYLNIKNPIDMDAKAGGLAAKWQEFFGEELDGRQLDGDMTNEEILRIVEEALMDAEVPDYEAYDYFSQFYEDNGIDGITHMGGGRWGNGPRHRVYIALSAYQVKSATGNEGKFSGDEIDIRLSLKSEEKKAVRETQDEDWQRIQSGDVTVPDIKVDNDTVRRQAAGALNKGLRDKLNQQIGMAANRIIRDTESKYGRNELKEKLTELVKQYAANGYDTHTALMAEALANQIIDQSTHKVQIEAAEVYQEARRQLRNAHISLTETQRQEVANEYGSVDAYRKAVFGTVNVRNEGVTLESLWDELSGKHPEIFPPDTGEAQMPGVIAQFDQLMRPRYENIYGMDAEAAAHDLAMRIQGDVLGMIGAKNAAHDMYGTADKFRKQIREEYDAEIMARQKQRVAEFQRIAGELRAAKDKGDAEAQKKIMAEYRKALKKVDVNTAIAEVRATEKVRYQQQTENRERAQLRDKITKRANELANMLIKPQKGKRVPTKLQGLVIDVLGALDVNGQRAAEAFKETKQAAEFREKLTGIKNFYAQVWDSQSKGESPEGLDGLMMTISERNMAEMAEALEVLGSSEAFYLRDMDSKQLKSLDALLKNVKHTVESIGKLWRIKRYESIVQLGDASIAEMDSRGPQKITNSTVGGARDFFLLDNMEPVSYGERLGEAGSEVIQSLLDGEKIKFGKIREASEATEKMLKEVGISGYDIGKWRKHVQVVTLGGMNVRMTDAMLMGLYLTAKRPKGRQHLLGGGFVLRDPKRTGAQEVTIRPTEADLAHMAGLLSDKQRQMADRMGEYLSTAVAKWGNDVTQRMYLYDAYTEKHYWPLSSDSSYHNTKEPETDRMFNAIVNASFTKPTNPKADGELVIMDAFYIFGRHIGEVASYAGYAEAITDTMAWLNYRVRNSETKRNEASVKRSMKNLLGNGGIQYLINLVQDINGARRGGDNMQLNKLLGNYKKAAVMGKIRVAIQQPTSIVRAAAEINPWHLIKGLRPTKGLPKGKSIGEWLRSNGTIEEMQKWSNLAWWKSNGNYDIGIGKGTDAILWGDTSITDTVMEKIATQGGLVDPGKMDDLTWAHMWLAVKSEIKRKRTDLEVGSDEYFRAVAERFEYVMDRTQVVDTVMHRSALMRGKDGLVKSLTSFMSEPTKSYNMLMRAVMEVGRHPKDRAAHKRLARTMLAYVASAAATAAATALYDAIRYRDDEEKTLDYLIKGEFGKDWAEQWLRGFMSNANLLDNIPGVSTAIGALKGEEATIMGFDTFTDIGTAYNKLMNYFLGDNTKKLTVYGAVSPAVKAASEALGLPFAGIMANVETLGRIFDPKWAQSKSAMATEEAAYAELYKAMASGDGKKALDIRTQMAKGMYGNQPKNPKEIDTGIYKELARQDERVMRAYEMKLAGNQSKELVALRKAIMADGFTEAQVNGAINYCETLTDTEVEENDMEAELEAKLYSTTDLFSAVRNGDADDVAAVADYLESVSNASDPEKSIRSSVSGEFREEYVDLVKAGQNGKARALAGKLAMVGIDQEYLDGWMKDSYKADMKQHVSDGKVQKALEAIDELKEYGMDVSGIVSSLNSEFKERYVELVNSGRRTEADRLGRTLQELDLYWKDGTTNYYRDEILDEWLEED